jgi:hypothetical protein
VLSLEPSNFTIAFETAWSPPIALIASLCDQHPDLEVKMTYVEPGMGFAGKVHGSGGVIHDEAVNEGDMRSFCEQEFGHVFDDEDEEDESGVTKH